MALRRAEEIVMGRKVLDKPAVQRYDVLLKREDGYASASEIKHDSGKYVLYTEYVELLKKLRKQLSSLSIVYNNNK